MGLYFYWNGEPEVSITLSSTLVTTKLLCGIAFFVFLRGFADKPPSVMFACEFINTSSKHVRFTQSITLS